MNNEQTICKNCVLDNTVADIWYDEAGKCKYCLIHDEMEASHPLNEEGKKRMDQLVKQIKEAGKGKEFDCVVGVSGGRDSTYTLMTAVKHGLRPLAVHFDNGWNTDISVKNIKNAVTKLGVTLHTVVADWEEFKDVQLSFLKASVPDADIPTDYAIYSVLYETAAKEGIRYILNGHSFRTEGTSPISWTYMDSLYYRNVHRRFGNKRITSWPVMSLPRLLYILFAKRVKEIRLMEFMDYRKSEVDRILEKELEWQYYGGHHHDNSFTKWFQSFYLPRKFNIDKRKTEFSALVRSGQMTRNAALEELNKGEYPQEKELNEYVQTKLDLSRDEFTAILHAPNRSHKHYRTLLPFIRLMKNPIKVASRFNIVPSILYLKYAR